jgi:hypothetical protein
VARCAGRCQPALHVRRSGRADVSTEAPLTVLAELQQLGLILDRAFLALEVRGPGLVGPF